MKAKILSILLIFSMTTSMFPAFAEETPTPELGQEPPRVEDGLYGEIEFRRNRRTLGKRKLLK